MLKRSEYPNVMEPKLEGVRIQDGVILRSFPCGGSLIYYFAKGDRLGPDPAAVLKRHEKEAWDVKHFGVRCPVVGKYKFLRCSVIERVLTASSHFGNRNLGGCVACDDSNRRYSNDFMTLVTYCHNSVGEARIDLDLDGLADSAVDEAADRAYYSQYAGCYHAGHDVFGIHGGIIAFFKRLLGRGRKS